MSADTSALKFSAPFVDRETGVLQRWAYQYLLNPTVSNLNVVGGASTVNAPSTTFTVKALNPGIPIRPSGGGTGLSSGTSGGVVTWTSATTIASSPTLGSGQIVLGGGAGSTPSTPVGLGSIHTLLHGNAAGVPSWSAVDLTADVTNALPVANGGTGQTAAGAAAANAIGALAEANNLSDLTNAGTARTNLGLGTIATQNANAVAITGGAIDGTTVGVTTAAAAKFTTLAASSTVSATGSPLAQSATQAVTAISGVKPGNSQATSNALTADSDLTLTFNETGTFALDGYLSFYETTLGTGGFQFDFNSGSATVGAINFGVDGFITSAVGNAAVTSVSTVTSFATIVTSSSAPSWVRITGYVKITGTGTFALRWAQASTLGADPTNLLAGSRLMATKIA